MHHALLHVDLVGLQGYVFRSRSLLDTVGRSAQLEAFTTTVAQEAISTVGAGAAPGVVVRVVFAGAGSLTVACTAPDPRTAADTARRVSSTLTRQVADTSDALTVVAAVLAVDGEVTERDRQLVAAQARAARHHTPAPLPVVLALGGLRCTTTGSAATVLAPPTPEADTRVPQARDVAEARARGQEWHATQQRQVLPQGGAVLPRRLDELGRAVGETSHLAVVVADLNGLGGRLHDLAQHHTGAPDTGTPDTAAPDGGAGAPVEGWGPLSAVAVALREMSTALITHLVGLVDAARDPEDPRLVRTVPPRLGVRCAERDGAVQLPLRPWVSAGDDLVVVCESRLAWSLGRAALDWWHHHPTDPGDPRFVVHTLLGDGPLTAGVGVAVVPVGYPLALAHESATALCHNAKQACRQYLEDTGEVTSALDWHRGTALPGDAALDRSGAPPHPGRAPAPATARPYLHLPQGDGSPLTDLLETTLGAQDPRSLRHTGAAGWGAHRGWLKSTLAAALLAGQDPAPVAAAHRDRQAQLHRPVPPELPTTDPGQLADALDLLDDHASLEVGA